MPVAAVAAAAGSGLLLVTPLRAFRQIVPILVATGSLTLLAQPALTALRQRRARDSSLLLLVTVGLLSERHRAVATRFDKLRLPL